METEKIARFGLLLSERLAPIARVIDAITVDLLQEHFAMDVLTAEEEDILICIARNVADQSPSATGAITSYNALAAVAALLTPTVALPQNAHAVNVAHAVNIENAGYAKPVGKPVRANRRKKSRKHGR